jgi:hypothetical protein
MNYRLYILELHISIYNSTSIRDIIFLRQETYGHREEGSLNLLNSCCTRRQDSSAATSFLSAMIGYHIPVIPPGFIFITPATRNACALAKWSVKTKRYLGACLMISYVITSGA